MVHHFHRRLFQIEPVQAMPTEVKTKQFWEEKHREVKPSVQISPSRYRQECSSIERSFLRRIGDVNGRRVLDLGCGTGELSVYLAHLGAHVTAIDISGQAIEKTRMLARKNQVAARVDGHVMDALEVHKLGLSFDLAVGKFALHHIEPFETFVRVLYDALKEDARGVFLENNASNRPLMMAREHLAGRFGVPKYGDDEEYPLEPEEVSALRQTFETVDQHFDDFICFRLLNTYLLRQKKSYATLIELIRELDRMVLRYLPSSLHKFSYHQIIEVQK